MYDHSEVLSRSHGTKGKRYRSNLDLVRRSFIHLEGIGHKTERGLWAMGIVSWDQFRRRGKIAGISSQRKSRLDKALERCEGVLKEGRYREMARLFPYRELWRLYPLLEPRARYLDIETDGVHRNCKLTVLGIARPGKDKLVHMPFVRDINLSREGVVRFLEGTGVLVTFNGSCFDLPVIRRQLGDILPRVPHLDLRHLAQKVGITGGLKALERKLGIARDGEVQMIAGNDAIRLWSIWKRKRHKRALEVLIDYNREDVVNLAPLASLLCDLMRRKLMARCSGR